MSEDSQRLRQAEWLEIVALALLSIVPILPYLTHVLDHRVVRFDLGADFALQEYNVRHVWLGETLLGLGSRWKWSHPGPLLFYFIAPFQKAFGSSSTGLYVGTWALSAASVSSIVGATRRWAGRRQAIAALVVITCWFGAFGNVAQNPWVRIVLALPLFAYLVLATLFARGAAGAAVAAIPFGCLVTQTHVLTSETVGVVGAVALAAFVLGARRRGGLVRSEKRWLVIAVGLLVLLFLPPLIEQARAAPGQGNISKLILFQQTRTASTKPLGDAFRNWTFANSWLVDRILSGTILEESGGPMVVRWDPVPPTVSRTAWTILVVQVLSCAVAAVVARWRRDATSLAFLGIGVLGSMLAVHSVRALAGQEHYSLLFWTASASAVAWIGVVSTGLGELWGAASRFIAPSRSRVAILIALGIVPVIAATIPQRVWLARFPNPTGTAPWARALHAGLYEAVRERTRRADAVPVIHQEGGWDVALAMLLEHDKDGLDVRIADADAWGIPAARLAREGRFLHFWFASPELPVPYSACLELVGNVGSHLVYAAPSDVTTCESAPR